METAADVIIVGAGIVGLATALKLQESYPAKRILVLDKEDTIAFHQSGRNSGVLHSGVYYKPGSLKAVTCRAGKRAMEEFCRSEDIPYEICGKVIVATDAAELALLKKLDERGRANGVQCEIVDRGVLAELEPYADGVAALHVKETGIVSFARVCERLAHRIREHGNQILTGARVLKLDERTQQIAAETSAGNFIAKFLVNCAGLQADRVAALAGSSVAAKIVPFRGEYFKLATRRAELCRNLIYPVPDPRFPFLGVHFTRRISGEVECGPNAVLALAREGYRKSSLRVSDLLDTVTYPGFLRFAGRQWRTGAGEIWRSLSKRAFVRALRRLVPSIDESDLIPGGSGVRAQAVARDGRLLDDFFIEESERIVNVLNAPSPAATASLAIGSLIVERLTRRFD